MAIIEVFEYTYRLDGQVCFEFGIVDFLFINCGVVNPFFIHKMVNNTKFQVCIKIKLKTNLTVQAVGTYC